MRRRPPRLGAALFEGAPFEMASSTDGGRPHKVKWEWLFNALWAGCRRSILRLQLPETGLFTDGQPTRWLGSTDRIAGSSAR